MDDFSRIALSIFMATAALVVSLMLPPHPVVWALAFLFGVVVALTFPSPP
jgi:hypothetical protein